MKRVPPKHDYAVAVRLAELWERFEYPELPTRVPFETGAGAGGAPTIVVAASNSSDLSKRKADIICAGVNDEQAIQAAVDTVGGGPARMLLAEGDYLCGTGTIVGLVEFTIVGMGRGTEIFTSTTGTFLELFADCAVRDLKITGSAGTGPNHFIQFDDGFGWVENVTFENGATAINLQGAGYLIRGCATADVPQFIDGSPFGSDVIVVENGLPPFADVGTPKITLGASADNWIIANNVMTGGIEDSGQATNEIVIANNVWENVDSDFVTAGHAIIDLAGNDTSHTIIANNVVRNGDGLTFINAASTPLIVAANSAVGIDDGILVQGVGLPVMVVGNVLECAGLGIVATGERVTIAGNSLESAEHGLSLTTFTHGTVTGNTLYWPGTLTGNTFDGVHVAGNSDDNTIVGNKVVPSPLANATRYGINIAAATCNNNAVYANYLGQSSVYGTADSVDSGTGTQTTPAAGAIGGQFAY